jgi:hypothetical protein
VKVRPATALLGAAGVASGLMLLSYARHLTFAADSWELLVRRQGWSVDDLLEPFHEHLIVGLALTYRMLQGAFGMDSAFPFFAVSTLFFVSCSVLLFALLRPRIGEWLALIAAVLLLFLGAASEDLLFEFQLGFFASVAAGLSMLLALERDDELGDWLAAAALAISIAFASIGIAFAAGAIANLAFKERRRRRTAFLVFAPLAAYVAWWLVLGRGGSESASLDNVIHLPGYVLDAAAAAIASLLGRDPVTSGGQPPVGAEILALVFFAALAYRLARERPLARTLAVAAAIGLAFWILGGLNRNPERYPTSSRYQYPGALFVLLILAELVRGRRLPRVAMVGLAVITVASVIGGIQLLDRDYTNFWRPSGEEVRATLGAVDLAGNAGAPDFDVEVPGSHFSLGAYRAAADAHGSPGYGEAELAQAKGSLRQLADRTLAGALALHLRNGAAANAGDRCPKGDLTRDGVAELRGPGTYLLETSGQAPVAVRLGRFAAGFPVNLGQLEPNVKAGLAIPPDAVRLPWRLDTDRGRLRIC